MRTQMAALGLALGLAACAGVQVHTDHDPNADFAKYRTYSWAPKPKGQEAPDISGVPSDLVEDRIRSEVDAQLAGKGLHEVPFDEHPDLIVHDHVVQKEKLDTVGTAYGFGYGYGPWVGYAWPSYNVRQSTEDSLVLDLVDARTEDLVWRGIATQAIGPPEKSAENIKDAVAATLKRYPPAKQES